MDQFVANQKDFSHYFPHMVDLGDAEKRKAYRPQAVRDLHEMIDGMTKAITSQADARQRPIGDTLNTYEAALVALNDKPTLADLDEREKGGDAEDAFRARRIRLTGQWFAASREEATQGLLFKNVIDLAGPRANDVGLTNTISVLAFTASTPQLQTQLNDLIINVMKNPAADRIRRNLKAKAKSASLVGNPLVLRGISPTGQAISTADWKGKVVLVDFWATWCGPCKAELPRVKTAYRQYHDQGLEVIGVSNDFTAGELAQYISQQNMPWPQLFDATAAANRQWNPTTLGFGINSIPRMYLIDRNGVCRSITAREDFEIQIPKLLAEVN